MFALFEERAIKSDKVSLDVRYGTSGQSIDTYGLEVSLYHHVKNGGTPDSGAYVSMLNEDMALYPVHEYGEDWPVYLSQLERVKKALAWWKGDMTQEEEVWTWQTLNLLERGDDPGAIFTAIMTMPADAKDANRYLYTQKNIWTYDYKFDDPDETHIRFQRFEGNRPVINTVDGERSDLQRQITIRRSDSRMYIYHGYTNGKQELGIQSATHPIPNEQGGPRTIAGTLVTEAKVSKFITALQIIHAALPERSN